MTAPAPPRRSCPRSHDNGKKARTVRCRVIAYRVSRHRVIASSNCRIVAPFELTKLGAAKAQTSVPRCSSARSSSPKRWPRRAMRARAARPSDLVRRRRDASAPAPKTRCRRRERAERCRQPAASARSEADDRLSLDAAEAEPLEPFEIRYRCSASEHPKEAPAALQGHFGP